MELTAEAIELVARVALAEDVGTGDVTTESVVPRATRPAPSPATAAVPARRLTTRGLFSLIQSAVDLTVTRFGRLDVDE